MIVTELAKKMWDSLAEKGVGVLCRPWIIQRDGMATAKAERYKKLIETQTEIDVQKMKDGTLFIDVEKDPKQLRSMLPMLTGDGKIDPVLNMDLLIESVRSSDIVEKIEDSVNLSKAIMHADSILSADSDDAPTKDVNDDWLRRWRENASKTSTIELQQIWGSVLAGEIKEPGSYSLRTIEFIKNLSKDEAINIERLYKFIFLGRIIRGLENNDSNEVNEKEGKLSFAFLNNMQNLGLISGVEAIGLTTTYISDHNEKFLKYALYNNNNKVLSIENEDKEKKLKLEVYLLTPLGHEVMSLCQSDINMPYLNMIINKIKDSGFTVSISDVLNINGNLSAINTVIV